MSRRTVAFLAGCIAAGGALHAAFAQSPRETTVLGPFTGPGAKLHPDNVEPHLIAYYGTDLGWTYRHGTKIHFLFGDTSATEQNLAIQASTGGRFDDSFGTIDVADWPDPTRISRSNLPLIRLGQNPGTTEMSAIDAGQPMEGFKTPIGGFSNGSREFGVFYSSKLQACQTDADCSSGLSCDTGLGYGGERPDKLEGITLACMEGTPGCTADTKVDAQGALLKVSGFCIDRTSSAWADTDVGRISAVGLTQLIGIRSTTDPRRYTDIQRWVTNKFSNAAFRAVDQDGQRRVFVWGRPGFIGVNSRGRPMNLYFAYVDMPRGPGFSWDVHYFSGTDAKGEALYSTNERDAAAVDLDSSQPGLQPTEIHDVVDHMSVVWIEHLKKWVMFYGGGMVSLPRPPALPTCGILEFFTRNECKEVEVGNGAIRMRTADRPWGPWSPPKDLLVGGDPDTRPLSGQYAAGGMLRHPDCTGKECAPHTNAYGAGVNKDEYGFLYGANIVEEWIRPAGAGVDVIWNASSWDPYRVFLVRTRIDPQ